MVVPYGAPALSFGEDISKNLVLFSFDSEDAGKYSNLKDGLKAMLSGKLAAEKGISVKENSLSSREQQMFIDGYPEKRLSAFRKLKAGYIGAGVMTASGERLQLQMTFYREDGAEPITIQAEAENERQILSAVETLSRKIGEQVFGFKPADAAPALQPSPQKGIEAFQTEHPDRKLKEEVVSGAAVSVEADMVISGGDSLRRTSLLSDGVLSMAVADLTGNGSEQIVVASENNLKIFQYDRGVLEELAVYPYESALAVHAMNIADLDGDGHSEIYLSAVENQRLSSMILTWNPKNGFQVLMNKIRWAIRPIDLPGEGYVLAGQSRARARSYFLERGIFLLNIDAAGQSISRGKRLFLPESYNLFDFVYGDIDGDGAEEIVSITSNTKLALHDRENSLVWIGEDDFGGSKTYLGSRWRKDGVTVIGEVANDGENYLELQYVPVRLKAVDINGDGKDEIISVKNTLATFRALRNLRGFSSGNVVCLSWDGHKMKELWATDLLDGHIADYDIMVHDSAKLDSPGKNEEDAVTGIRLYAAQIPTAAFANVINISSKKGNLVVYNFKIRDKALFSQEIAH